MSKKVKAFKVDGEEYASICLFNNLDGPKVIDINMDSFEPREARRLARWLVRAAGEVQAYNAKRRKKLARK